MLAEQLPDYPLDRPIHVARTAASHIAHGRLQRQESVVHVLVNKLEDLSSALRGLGSQSREYH